MSLIKWDYDQSVKKVSILLGDLKAVVLKKSTLTDEIVKELYEAREFLSNRGSWAVVQNGTTQKGWGQYLEDCGLKRTTVHYWLEHYEPTEQRLLTDDEFEAKQQKKRLEEKTAQEQIRAKVNVAYKTGNKPENWDAKCEKAYQEKIEEERQRDERIAKAKESMQRERERNEQIDRETKQAFVNIDKMVQDAMQNTKEKNEFKQRIRLSPDGLTDGFVDVLMEYLEELEDDNRRIEACYNIIKVCKGIAVDLQVRSN